MPSGKMAEEIQARIASTEERLGMINNAISKEMERPFFERRNTIFRFLDIEKRIYSTVLKELKYISNA